MAIAVWGLVTVALVVAARVAIPAQKVCPDFICFWSAAELIADGHTPYDSVAETRVQRTYGWNKATDGIGLYDCLPYFYPPWFAALFLPLLPLGYPVGKMVWLVINIELLAMGGVLIRRSLPSLSPRLTVMVVCAFALSVYSVLMGQTPPLIFFLLALTWRLLDQQRDWLAGSVMAWAIIKPQLTAVILLGLLLWAVRRRRWNILFGLAATLGILTAAFWAVIPWWPLQMVRATSQTPLPTDYFPWYGTTWLLALKSTGLRSWALWGLYLAVALPFLAAVVQKAWDPKGQLSDLLAIGMLAAFFVAPYGQPYDFTVLLIPFLVLLGERLSEKSSAALLLAVLILPYVHITYASQVRLWWLPARPAHQVTLLWLPVLLTIVWLATLLRTRHSSAKSAQGGIAEPA